MLDTKHTPSSVKHNNPDVYSGHIGPINVVISHIPLSLHSTDITVAVESIMASPTNIKSILVMSATGGLNETDISPGDLIINAQIDRDEDHSDQSVTEWNLSQQVAVLQKESGHDGRWLSSNFPTLISCSPEAPMSTHSPEGRTSNNLRLYYGILGQNDQNSPEEKSIVAKFAQDFISFAKGLAQEPLLNFLADWFPAFEHFTTDVVTIHTVGSYADSNDSAEIYAAASAASFTKELIRGMSDGLMNSIAGLRGTESVVPPDLEIEVPPFEPQQYPRYGNAVLLVIPTANKSKGKLLEEGFKKQRAKDVVMHSISLPFDSGVGEQPYNEAGILGAHTRISNASRQLNKPEYQAILVSKGIGTVLVASIENYIQLDNVERPIDYGVLVIHNASTGKTTAGLSWGVTVPPAYVDRARRFGFEGNPNYGRVTVGQILAAHVPGLDKGDFHGVLVGRSRYDLLSEVIDRLKVPWY